jgi:hypothetical protein
MREKTQHMSQPQTGSSSTKSTTSKAASSDGTNAATAASSEPAKKRALPKGYTKQSTDVVGFYDEEVQDEIHFIPLEAVHQDSSLDERKVSTLIFGKLVDPCRLTESAKSGNVVQGKVDDIVGVWYRPGMRDIRMLGGVPVFMYPDGIKDTGKPNPMKKYSCNSVSKGKRIVIIEDRRDKSKGISTDFDAPDGGPAPF